MRVKEGSFLLAIDGHDLRTTDNPYRLLENKASVPVVLKVADDARAARARARSRCGRCRASSACSTSTG